MGWRNNCPAVSWSNVYFDRLWMIQKDSGLVTLTLGISNCSLQNYLKIKFLFFPQVLAKFPFKLKRLIQQSVVSLNYSQSIKINIGPSNSEMIGLLTHHPTILHWRLSDFSSELCTRGTSCPKNSVSHLWPGYIIYGCPPVSR